MNRLVLAIVLVLAPFTSKAQCPNGASSCVTGVPHFVKFNGTVKNLAGVTPDTVIAMRFVIYGDSTGGTPLWQEVQNAQVDSAGHYDVVLGVTSSEGIPIQLFTSGEPRWLGVQPLVSGAPEQDRVLLVSVPYALQAADAQTLGGLPPSAFERAPAVATVESAMPVEAPVTGPATAPVSSGLSGSGIAHSSQSANVIPKFSNAYSLVDSQIADVNGMVTMSNLGNLLFADRYLGGVPDAIKACPANGCIIYALSPKTNLNLGTVDPGTKAITIYLGPYTYTVKQVMLRKGLKIIGMGGSGSPNGTPTCSVAKPCNGTTLQSVNGNNPAVVIPQDNNDPATSVLLSGFRLVGSAGNTSEDGFLLDTSSAVNTGLWSSKFEDIGVVGFSGIGIHVKGRNNDFASLTQWVLFNNVAVIRNPGGGNALRLEGAVFELRFRNCQFDGQVIGDGTNIYIGGSSGGQGGYPTSIAFEGLISQQAATAVHIDGGVNLTFYGSHHESLWGGYDVTSNSQIRNYGITIMDAYFAGNVGKNNGAGYILNIETTLADGIVFEHNGIFASVDAVLKGTNYASVVYQDNGFQSASSTLPLTSGLTTQISPAPSIDIRGVHSIGLNPSSVPITTIQSALGPGETVTFFTLNGAVTFGAGGNIDLMGMTSLTVNGTITLVRSDLGGLEWKVASQWSPTVPGQPLQARKSAFRR